MNILICFVCIYFPLLILATKNLRTLMTRNVISNAIFLYNTRQITDGIINDTDINLIDFSVMESYNRTLFRLYDWGYKHIVPPDVYDRISPIIKEVMDNVE